MTYDKSPDQSLPSNPRNIDKLGYKDAFHYTTVWKGKKVQKNISALAYKSGTGNAVALSLSTIDTGSHWDFVPNDDCHHKWYFSTNLTDEERQLKGFKLIIGESRRSPEILLLSKVDTRTCGPEGQGSREWFVDRMFSGTSSTIHHIFKKCIPLLADDEDDDIVNSLKVVLSFTGEMKILEKIQEEREEEQRRQQQASEQNEETSQDNEEDRDKEEATEWISKLSASKDFDNQFKQEVADATITSRTVDWIVAITTDSPFKEWTVGAAKKKIDKWLEGTGEGGEAKYRPYKSMTKASLKKILQERGDTTWRDSDSKLAFIKKILAPPESSTNPGTDESEDIHLDALAEIINKSFLQPLNDKAEKTAASIGHKNEITFIKSFCEKCLDDNDNCVDSKFAKITDISVYRPGLVKKKGSKFIKGSADGILAAKVSILLCCLFVCLETKLILLVVVLYRSTAL